MCVCVCTGEWGVGGGAVLGAQRQDLVCRRDLERALTRSCESGLDSWHDLCDLGLTLSPLSFIFLIWNLGLFSLSSVSLKADVNGVGGGEERGEKRRKSGGTRTCSAVQS